MQTSAPLAPVLARTFRQRLDRFLAPLLIRLDKTLNSRLVKTFAAMIGILLQNRYRSTGLR